MNKKEKTKKIIMGVSTLALLGTTILGGGALAKYISKISGVGSIDVAKWNVNMDEIELSNTHYTAQTLSENVIAPGTEGSFDVVIDAGGTETGVDYTVDISNIENKPTNLYFEVDGAKCTSIDGVIEALSGHIDANEENKKVEKTVNWKWDYETGSSSSEIETNDEMDTDEGKLANSMEFDVTVKAVQSRPVAQ